MKYTVGWTPGAKHDLARFWLGARDRISIGEASEAIERQLSTDPLNAGESRVGRFRVLIVEPLVVVYSVQPEDRLVKVVQVTYHKMFRRP